MTPSSEPAKNSALDLEFPDWSGMKDTGRMVAPATALRLVEVYYRWFPGKRDLLERRWAEKCEVEFVL